MCVLYCAARHLKFRVDRCASVGAGSKLGLQAGCTTGSTPPPPRAARMTRRGWARWTLPAPASYNDFDIIFGHLSSFIAPQARRVMYRTRSPCLSAAVRCLQSDVTPNFPCQAFDTRWRLYGASPFGTTMLSADKTSVKLQGGGYCVRQLRHGRLGRFFPFFPGASPVLPPHTRHIDMLDFIFELVVAPIQCWVLIDACIPML